MIDDAFKRERENIRAKMLKYSRAVNEGKRTDEILAADEIATPKRGDDVLKKRLEKDKNPISIVFEEEKKGRLGLKKDLIDVKLEEKTSLAKLFFSVLKKKKSPPKASNTKLAPQTNAAKKQSTNSNERLNANSPKPNSAQNTLNSAKNANSQKNPSPQNERKSQNANALKSKAQNVNLSANLQANENSQVRANSQDLHSPNSTKRRILDIKIDTQPKNSAQTKHENTAQKEDLAHSANAATPNLAHLTNATKNSVSHSPQDAQKPNLAPLSATNSHLQSRQSPQIQPKATDEDNVKVKNTLLQGHSRATQDEKNLGKNQLLFAALCIVFAVVVFVPKIYITSNIYYLSRDIAALRTQESVLSEENKELNKRLENMRFQNQILDYLE